MTNQPQSEPKELYGFPVRTDKSFKKEEWKLEKPKPPASKSVNMKRKIYLIDTQQLSYHRWWLRFLPKKLREKVIKYKERHIIDSATITLFPIRDLF